MSDKCILALGFFDGVHAGHAALLRACLDLAQQNNCRAGVVTFGNHPDKLVMGTEPGLINTLSDRERLLRQNGMEKIIVFPFDRKLKAMPWRDFIAMLMEKHNAAGFVCGEDFHFGRHGQGKAEKLLKACAEMNLPCAVVPQQRIDDITVSSTHIRYLMETGHMSQAVRFLGHPHVLTGKVVHGHQLGRKLGIPTANLMLPKELVVPKFGVYACVAVVDGQRYCAVTNVGTRPTVAGIGITVEPWILDYQGDLYDREITLEFYQFLRPEQRFSTLEALKHEIHHNAEEAREILKERLQFPPCTGAKNVVK